MGTPSVWRSSNHKRVARILREDNSLWLRRKKLTVTTDSNHGLRFYPNLVGNMEPTRVRF